MSKLKFHILTLNFLILAANLSFAHIQSQDFPTSVPKSRKFKKETLKLVNQIEESESIDSAKLSKLYFDLGLYYEQKKRWAKSMSAFRKSNSILNSLGDSLSYNFLLSQNKKTELTQWAYFGKPKVDLDGWPDLSFHIGQRGFRFPTGKLGVVLPNLDGTSAIYEQDFKVNNVGYAVDLNLFGVSDNMSFTPYSHNFWVNTYLFWSFRMTFATMFNNSDKYGFSFLAEMGADFGFKRVFSKNIYGEFGLKTTPLAMSYSNLGSVNTEDHSLPYPYDWIRFVYISQNSYYLAATPYFRAGFFVKKNNPSISIDFTLGYHYVFNYGRTLLITKSGSGLEDFDIPKDDFLMNGNQLTKNTFNLSGNLIGLGVKFVFN